MNNLRGRRFRFTTLETSGSFAKGIFEFSTIAWSILDVWNLEKRQDNEDPLNVKIVIFVVDQALSATSMDFLQALTLQIHF